MELMQKVEFKKRNVRPTPASKKQPSPAIHPLKRVPLEKRQSQAGKDNCEVPMLPHHYSILGQAKKRIFLSQAVDERATLP
jgi:hypothetical protein